MSNNFEKCIGIELIKNLHNLTNKLKENLKNFKNDLLCKEENIQFFHNDFIKFEYENLDIFNETSLILINCKTFTKELMNNIAQKYSKMSKDTYMITSFQNMEEFDSSWKNLEVLRKVMSWGPATMYINIKI